MRIVVVLVLGFVFFGCSVKVNYTQSGAYAFVIKNSKIAIADTGFIKHSAKQINLQIYKASESILELDIRENACINGVCLQKEEFNRRFFSFRHYPELMEDILRKEPLYEGKNLVKTKSGFEQTIKTDDFDILYEVTEETSYFKDRKNGVLLKLKSLQ